MPGWAPLAVVAAAAGTEQHNSTCASPRGASGSSTYSTAPLVMRVAQVPQMPERQPNTGARPTASASSSRLPRSRDHSAVTADFANRTGTAPSPSGAVRADASGLTSGVSAVPDPNDS